MPGSNLQRAKKKLSEGINSWRKKYKSRAPLDQISPPSSPSELSATQDIATGSQSFAVFACGHGLSRDAERSDSTLSPDSPSTASLPPLSPSESSEDGEQLIDKLFSGIIGSVDDTSEAETEGDMTLVGDDCCPSSSEDDVFWPSHLQEANEGGCGESGGFRQYCGTVQDLLGDKVSLGSDLLSDSEYSSDSTLLSLTLSSDEGERPKKMQQIRVHGRHGKRKLSVIGKEKDVWDSHAHVAIHGRSQQGNGDMTKGTHFSQDAQIPDLTSLPPKPTLRPRPPLTKTEKLTDHRSLLKLTHREDLSLLNQDPSHSGSCPELNSSTTCRKTWQGKPATSQKPIPNSTCKLLIIHNANEKPATVIKSPKNESSSKMPASLTNQRSSGTMTSLTNQGSSGTMTSLTNPQAKKTRNGKSPPHLLMQKRHPHELKNCTGGATHKELPLGRLPGSLSVCNCHATCQKEVKMKHVENGSDSVHLPPRSIKHSATGKAQVCHHPQCTEDNKDLPLLLCQQCSQDIHRQPEYHGHLVLDYSNKRFGGGFSRQAHSLAGSESDDSAQQDDDSVDGRQLFLKKPSKDFSSSRTSSDVERKLKRKKAVKKKSVSRSDSQRSQYPGLEAALQQIAYPEGPDLMANLSAEAEGEGQESGTADPGRKDSLTSELSLLTGLEPLEPCPEDSPIHSSAQRTPVKRQTRVPLQDNYFTIKVYYGDSVDAEDLEVVAAVPNTTLREAVEPVLERRGIDINTVNVFIEKSHTPLPTSSDTSFLVGNTLEIKGKDEQDIDMVSQGSGGKQRLSSASKASSSNSSQGKASKTAVRNTRRESVGVATLLEPPPTKERRGSLQLPFREHFFASKGDNSQNKSALIRSQDDPFGSLRTRRAQNLSVDDSFTGPTVSPQGTLTNTEGKKGKRISVVNFFANNNNKEREKYEQLQDLLNGYSINGLPRLPDLLSFGRPTFDETVFQVEKHWSLLVENASLLTKRQHDQQEAIWELLTTEMSYISQIRVITDVFKNCLLNVQQEGLLNEIELDRLFSNIDQILDSNCRLWQDSLCRVLLEARTTKCPLNSSFLKPAFTREFHVLSQPYTRYCVEQKQCAEYMKSRQNDNELFKSFVLWAETQKQCNRLKLTDLLVKPMQRLTKYSLLLQAILRKTDNDQQRKDLLEMIGSVDKYVGSINSQMQRQDELERVEAIMTKIEPYDAVEAPTDECDKIMQEYNSNFNLMTPMAGFYAHSNRTLLMQSSLKMKEAQSRTDVDLFLFTDLILVCKAGRRKYKIIRPPMWLDHFVVSELKDKGSFLLIYLNEYCIPISAFTFHSDQAGIRCWLEKIRDAQTDYRRRKQEDWRQHQATTALTRTAMEGSPEGLLTMEALEIDFPRSASVESIEGRFLPTIMPVKPQFTPSPEKPPTGLHGKRNPLERTGSCNEIQSTTANSSRETEHPRHISSSPDFSAERRQHKLVTSCYSVPNIRRGQPIDQDDEDDDEQGLTMDVFSVQNVVGSSHSSLSNLAEPGPVDEDYNGRLIKSNQRRVSRSEKRYYTADSIQELRQKDKDASIHKRLSWQNENHMEVRLRTKVLSTDSVQSIPSSSGVSSSGSLHHAMESDISEEAEPIGSGSSRTLQKERSHHLDVGSVTLTEKSKAKSTPDIAMLCSSLKTGQREDGISSVLLPGTVQGNRQLGKLTQSQILHMKKQMLLNMDVEASEV